METNTFAAPKSFAELGLSAKVQQAIVASGYTTPTPIQAEAIPVAMAGRDVLGIAQTGTGKTASFTLPMISRLETGRARARMPRSLILAPTRELAAQVAASFDKYGINHKLDVALLIGGVSMDEQTKKLDRGVDVLIATPGRLMDHFQRGRVMLMGVEILVIDEADRMLDMGFIPDIEKICKLLPPRKQTLFFSATMPAEITRLTNQFLVDPVRIEVAPPATSAKTITQAFAYCSTGEDWAKRDTLRTLLRGPGVRNAIIFANRKVEVAILLKSLVKHGFNAGAIHGDMDQKARMETLDKFRNGEIAFLVGSDVAARGLDIPDVSHVFNYDLPRDKDDYVHRIGRTGRAGKEGHSFSLVTGYDLKQLQEIEKMIGEPAVWAGEPPTEQDYADAGKKKRGRSPSGVGAARLAGARERPMPRHAERGGERRPAHAPAGSHAHSGRPPRPSEDDQPVRREILNTGQRRSTSAAPGLEPQPDITSAGSMAAGRTHEPRPQQDRPERGPQRVRSRGSHAPSRGEGRTNDRAEGRTENRPDPRPDNRVDGRSNAPRNEGRNEPRRDGGDNRRNHSQNRSDNHPGSRQPEVRQEGVRQEVRSEPRQDNRPAPQPREREQRAPAPRETREPREARTERAPQQARPDQPRPDNANRGGDRGNDRNGGGASSFADNVPAFLQRPVRPVKAASE